MTGLDPSRRPRPGSQTIRQGDKREKVTSSPRCRLVVAGLGVHIAQATPRRKIETGFNLDSEGIATAKPSMHTEGAEAAEDPVSRVRRRGRTLLELDKLVHSQRLRALSSAASGASP